jgi:hypothetical protein
MTEEGEKILKAVRQMRELHRSVSLLLMSVDAAMAEHGWTNVKEAGVIYGYSYSIGNSERWMPWEIFRYYKYHDDPSMLASISVLLDNAEGKLSEPLLSGALFVFVEGRMVKNFDNRLASIYTAIPSRDADGNFVEIAPSQLELKWQSDFERGWCFALPLVDIMSAADLRQRVVERLVAKAGSLTAAPGR